MGIKYFTHLYTIIKQPVHNNKPELFRLKLTRATVSTSSALGIKSTPQLATACTTPCSSRLRGQFHFQQRAQ